MRWKYIYISLENVSTSVRNQKVHDKKPSHNNFRHFREILNKTQFPYQTTMLMIKLDERRRSFV